MLVGLSGTCGRTLAGAFVMLPNVYVWLRVKLGVWEWGCGKVGCNYGRL